MRKIKFWACSRDHLERSDWSSDIMFLFAGRKNNFPTVESSSVSIHFEAKLFCPQKGNIMSLDQSERSEWSREQAQNLIFTFFLIIIIITRCSGMFHVPGFIDGPCSGDHLECSDWSSDIMFLFAGRTTLPRNECVRKNFPPWEINWKVYI